MIVFTRLDVGTKNGPNTSKQFLYLFRLHHTDCIHWQLEPMQQQGGGRGYGDWGGVGWGVSTGAGGKHPPFLSSCDRIHSHQMNFYYVRLETVQIGNIGLKLN